MSEQSNAEATLLQQIKLLGITTPETEYRFAPPRRWRFDLAWPALHFAVEIDGGGYVQGRHSRGQGIEKDCEKYEAAMLDGWTVYRCTPRMVRNGGAVRVVSQMIGAINDGKRTETERGGRDHGPRVRGADRDGDRPSELSGQGSGKGSADETAGRKSRGRPRKNPDNPGSSGQAGPTAVKTAPLPSRNVTEALEPTPELSGMVATARALRAELDAAQLIYDQAIEALKVTMGTARGIVGLVEYEPRVRRFANKEVRDRRFKFIDDVSETQQIH
jgi:hypothetical protein